MNTAEHVKAGDILTDQADATTEPGAQAERASLYLGAIAHYLAAVAEVIGAPPATPHPAVSGG